MFFFVHFLLNTLSEYVDSIRGPSQNLTSNPGSLNAIAIVLPVE